MSPPRYKWQPTTAEIARRAGIEPDEVIRFDHNTSPFPTPWAAAEASRVAARLNEYPGADYRPIREAAARSTGLDPDRIVPGAGVDELILLIGRAFLGPDRRSLQVSPTYPLYEIATAQVGAALTSVQARPPSFSFPIEELTAEAARADVVWLCAPNNPTGVDVAPAEVGAVLRAAKGLVVVDAAYAEFAGVDWSALVVAHDNAVVLRTLSKAYGLAGARVGFAMAHPDVIAALDGVRPPGSISSMSVEVAVGALDAPERMKTAVAELTEYRDHLSRSLAALGWRPLPSATNFVLSEVGPHAHELAAALMDRGLVVRTFEKDPLREHIRVTVRTPHEHDRLVTEIRRLDP